MPLLYTVTSSSSCCPFPPRRINTAPDPEAPPAGGHSPASHLPSGFSPVALNPHFPALWVRACVPQSLHHPVLQAPCRLVFPSVLIRAQSSEGSGLSTCWCFEGHHGMFSQGRGTSSPGINGWLRREKPPQPIPKALPRNAYSLGHSRAFTHTPVYSSIHLFGEHCFLPTV